MALIAWEKQINFASALLLHSCLTVLVKELCNAAVLFHRAISLRLINQHIRTTPRNISRESSAVLDAYTSVFSKDTDGELAELYYTNTGAILLSATLASSVAMNLYLHDRVLNGIIVGTFCFCFVASLIVGKKRITILIVALRRAGRFIWADTPFVNFFTLIYIATALRGSPTIRVKDYVAFRGIAVLELLFMKAKLAARSPDEQQAMMERLIQSELLVTKSVVSRHKRRLKLSGYWLTYLTKGEIEQQARTVPGKRCGLPNVPKAQFHAVQDDRRLRARVHFGRNGELFLRFTRDWPLDLDAARRLKDMSTVPSGGSNRRLPESAATEEGPVVKVHSSCAWCAAQETWKSPCGLSRS
jgi:hypothetical protein